MDEREHQWHDFPEFPRLTILPWVLWALLAGIAIGGVLFAGQASAAPLFRAETDGVTITLYDEDCKLSAVSNLKKRATWTEKGKTYEGCVGQHPAYPIFMAYFSDKTFVVLPIEIFSPVSGA